MILPRRLLALLILRILIRPVIIGQPISDLRPKKTEERTDILRKEVVDAVVQTGLIIRSPLRLAEPGKTPRFGFDILAATGDLIGLRVGVLFRAAAILAPTKLRTNACVRS